VLHVHPPLPSGVAGGGTAVTGRQGERALSVNPYALGARMSTDDEPPADISGPTVPRMILGNQLRRYREAAGISPDRAGYEIRASRSKISRMENGRVGFKERDVADLLNLYGVTDEETRASLMTFARQANAPGWWSKYGGDIMTDWFEEYLGLEAAASVIRVFELQFVHGLFQTEAYARAVTLLGNSSAPAEEIDRRVGLRLKRQDLLTRPRPPQVWAVLDEGALRRPVGGRAVMRGQLNRLIEVAGLRQVTIQAVPFSRGGHAAAGGSFTALRFEDEDVPDVVYIEQLTSALYLDKREDVDHYLEVMNRLSTEALTPAQTRQFLAAIIKET
jgi:transcriptional regulator with XRE-family HTH domain